MKVRLWKSAPVVLLMALVAAGWLAPPASYGEEKLAASEVSQETAKPKFRGRLPAYYGRVVTADQRAEIYAIQAKYHARIHALKAQLASLESQRDAEVADVLKPEQRKELAEIIAAAKAERKQAAANRQAKKLEDKSQPK